jgi:uncharacterized protein
MAQPPHPARPWYREPWPWILMAGPAVVVVAALASFVIAARTADGLVADDYYRQGMAINKVLKREAHARALHVGATLRFDPAHERLRVVLSSDGLPPRALRVSLVHPTLEAEDQSVLLASRVPGVYEGALARAPRIGAWTLRLEDPDRTWRVTGDWQTGAREVTLDASGP